MTPPAVWRPLVGGVTTSRYVRRDVITAAFPPRARLGKRYRGDEFDGWVVGRAHLDAVVGALADHYGSCVVFLDFERHGLCTGSCQGASPLTVTECVCIRGGLGHGVGKYGRPVGDNLMIITEESGRRPLTVRRGQSLQDALLATQPRPPAVRYLRVVRPTTRRAGPS